MNWKQEKPLSIGDKYLLEGIKCGKYLAVKKPGGSDGFNDEDDFLTFLARLYFTFLCFMRCCLLSDLETPLSSYGIIPCK